MSIKAIDTNYKGYRFRSRLEARWAVFFDALGIDYRYEEEGYELSAGWYLPDFWVPRMECWIEIKPECRYAPKAESLAQESGKGVFLIGGTPGADSYRAAFFGEDVTGQQSVDPGPYVFAQGRKDEHDIWLSSEQRQICIRTCGCVRDEKPPLEHFGRISRAYDTARSARFEHGDAPVGGPRIAHERYRPAWLRPQ